MRPDFLIVGAPKAGTTWLYRNLGRSSEVFMTPNKEPRYYSVEEGTELAFRGPGDEGWMREFVVNRRDYEALYAGAAPGQIRGEASSDYLYRSETAARRIREDAPGARIIVMLRDPVHRAHSNWVQHLRDGREELPFGEAMKAEPKRIESGWSWWWHYGQRGFFARQLEPFLECFPADQVLILRYEQLRADPAGLLRRAASFLEVAPVGSELEERRNPSLVSRSPAHRVMRRALQPNAATRVLIPQRARTRLRHAVNRATLYRPQITPEEYAEAQRLFAADTTRLGEIADLDVSGWLR